MKSAAQALLGTWTLGQLDVLHADWRMAAGIAGGAALLSVLTSLASLALGPQDSPSLVSLRRDQP